MSQKKVAIVTGGSNGIGAEIAVHFLSQNKQVVIVDKESCQLHDPERLLFIKTDVSSEVSVKKMVQKAIQHFGQIDILINNAGILPNNLPPIEKLSSGIWNTFIAINLTGPFLCSKHVIPYMKKKGGSIINIASTRAHQSIGNDAPYAASKGGLVALSRALAIELGPFIRVNSISPGWIHTEQSTLKKRDHQQHPAGRVGEPQDVAHLVSFLVSDEAGFITGQDYRIDGGMTSKMIYAD